MQLMKIYTHEFNCASPTTRNYANLSTYVPVEQFNYVFLYNKLNFGKIRGKCFCYS